MDEVQNDGAMPAGDDTTAAPAAAPAETPAMETPATEETPAAE